MKTIYTILDLICLLLMFGLSIIFLVFPQEPYFGKLAILPLFCLFIAIIDIIFLRSLKSTYKQPYIKQTVLIILNITSIIASLTMAIALFNRKFGQYRIWLGSISLLYAIGDLPITIMILRNSITQRLRIKYILRFTILASLLLGMAIALIINSRKSMKGYLHDLQFGDDNERSNAVSMLANYNDKEVKKALVDAIGDDYYEVRTFAIESLVAIGDKKALPAIKQAIHDGHDWVRGAVAIAIGKLGSEEDIETLIELIDDTSMGVRQRAIMALGSIGNENVIPLIKQQVSEADIVIREYTIPRALAKLGDIASYGAIINGLKNDGKRDLDYEFEFLKEITEFKTYNSVEWWKNWWVKNQGNVYWEKLDRKWHVKDSE